MKPATKASAVFVVSGGMVASFALPASAATHTPVARPKAPVATVVLPTPAPTAAQAPLVSPSFGDIGFSGVAKLKPVPAPLAASRDNLSVSRSASRLPVTQAAGPVDARAARIISIAASLNGTPYLYGGTTTAGFDCSGYSQYVFNKIGISLPRTAEEQRQFAARVSIPKVGDLVFFGIPAYHNGIYAGNGMMWDAPRTGRTVGLHAIWSGTVTYGRV